MAYKGGKYTNAAYSYEEAKLYLAQYKEALTALVDGQAKEYTIGSRSVTLLDLEDIERMVDKFAAIVEKYETNSRPPRNVAVVFRDM
ncbi:MAG: hypothetical protein IKN04_08960 [Clostridia bacterium]|nr:hypothetical protein [Clostridia bacterium]